MTKKIIGLGGALVVPAFFTLLIIPLVINPSVIEPFSTLVSLGIFWGLAIVVLGFTRIIENRPLASIGWKPMGWQSALLAVGFGIVLSLLVPVLTLLTSSIFPPSDAGTIAQVASDYPWWLLLLSVLTAGITEEILFRGYPLERLHEITGSKWISGIISLIFFVAVHATGWNIAHIVGVVLPLGMILTILYFWKQNLKFVMIVHIVINLPLVFMALLTR